VYRLRKEPFNQGLWQYVDDAFVLRLVPVRIFAASRFSASFIFICARSAPSISQFRIPDFSASSFCSRYLSRLSAVILVVNGISFMEAACAAF
jgi:hypothetical protein